MWLWISISTYFVQEQSSLKAHNLIGYFITRQGYRAKVIFPHILFHSLCLLVSVQPPQTIIVPASKTNFQNTEEQNIWWPQPHFPLWWTGWPAVWLLKSNKQTKDTSKWRGSFSLNFYVCYYLHEGRHTLLIFLSVLSEDGYASPVKFGVVQRIVELRW